MSQNKSSSQSSSKKSSAKKPSSKKSPKKTASKKSLFNKSSAKKSSARSNILSINAASQEFDSSLIATKYRPICITCHRKLGPYTQSQQEAEDVTKEHEIDNPTHVTDVEEKNN